MKVLIVEDDPGIAENLRKGLAADFHTVEIAENGADGSFLARTFEYDAIVLDYSLPKKNGLIVCKEIRASGKTTPIIFLSVTDDSSTKVEAFESGADDYVTKPFFLKELSARLCAITRRSDTVLKSKLQIRDIILDTDSNMVSRAGKVIHLTRKEYSLLEYFMRHPYTVISRTILMEHVWTADQDPFSNTVEASIHNLRKKINLGFRPELIINLPGRGYVLDRPDPGPKNLKSSVDKR